MSVLRKCLATEFGNLIRGIVKLHDTGATLYIHSRGFNISTFQEIFFDLGQPFISYRYFGVFVSF